jgi:hypothetical protein
MLEFNACGAGSSRSADGQCAKCPPDSYKTDVGDSACTPCPQDLSSAHSGHVMVMTTNGVLGAISPTQCLCPVGTFLPAGVQAAWAAGAWVCAACPFGAQSPQFVHPCYLQSLTRVPAAAAAAAGAVCNMSGLAVERIPSAPGYWRGSALSTVFDVCLHPSKCLSGIVSTTPGRGNGTPCVYGAAGALCFYGYFLRSPHTTFEAYDLQARCAKHVCLDTGNARAVIAHHASPRQLVLRWQSPAPWKR